MKKTTLSKIQRGYVGCVYVAELDDGVIKVGFSRNPRTRLASLAHQVRRRFDAKISRYYVSANLHSVDAYKSESMALRKMREISKQVPETFEYFHDVCFDQAVSVVAGSVKDGFEKSRFKVQTIQPLIDYFQAIERGERDLPMPHIATPASLEAEKAAA